MKSGDPRRLPQDVPATPKVKPPEQKIAHLEKTVGYGRQAARNLPAELEDYEIVVRDRYWKQGGVSVVVRVKPPGPPATVPGTPPPPAPSGAAEPHVPAKPPPSGAAEPHVPAKPPPSGAAEPHVPAKPPPSGAAEPHVPAKPPPSGAAEPHVPAKPPPSGAAEPHVPAKPPPSGAAEPHVPAKPPPSGAAEPHVPAKPPPSGAAEPHVPAGRVKAVGRAAAGAAIRMGGQMALTAVVLESQRRELQQAIANAHRYVLPFVEDLKSRDPDRQVYISLTIRQSSFQQYIPFEGWVPAEDKLELWQFHATTDAIDPPKETVEDHSLNVLRPGKIIWTTYTEPADLPASQAAITSHPELRSVSKLGSASATREWVGTHDPSVIGMITADEKARLINMLLDGWVSDEDIATVRKLYTSSPSDQRAGLRELIERRIPELNSIGQRTALRVILALP